MRYEVGELGSGVFVDVPIGFDTDGASIPRFLWAILPTWGRYSRAAVVHDYLYRMLRESTPHPAAPSRKKADGIFLEAMAVLGVSRLVRYVIWGPVRLFGGSSAKAK